MTTPRSSRTVALRSQHLARLRRWKEEDDEYVVGSLEPEHNSVEDVDEDDDDYQAEELVDAEELARQRRRSERRRPRSEVVDADEHLIGPQRKQLTVSVDPQDEDDNDDDDAPEGGRPRTEEATLEDIQRALTINSAYLQTLRDQAAYYRSRNIADDPDLKRVERAMNYTEGVLSDWMLPVTQAAPVEHTVPATLPDADGSEKRFTEVAAALGIKWSLVNETDKSQVYSRAVDLHVELYGARPRKVRMHTNEGYQPVYYYNAATYRNTMRRALLEYKQRNEGIGIL